MEVRKKITSQKKEILEGSEEWDVLYRKYYQDELRRLGIAAVPTKGVKNEVTEFPQLRCKTKKGGQRPPFLFADWNLSSLSIRPPFQCRPIIIRIRIRILALLIRPAQS